MLAKVRKIRAENAQRCERFQKSIISSVNGSCDPGPHASVARQLNGLAISDLKTTPDNENGIQYACIVWRLLKLPARLAGQD